MRRPVRREEETRVNHRIRFPQIRVIDPEGNQLGVMSPDEGRDRAKQFGLDLVEVAAKARPPVCRIMDYGKYRYEQSKKASASKGSRTQSKTFRMRPNIEEHDLDTKLRKATQAIDNGDQVRLVMRMRGRERAVPGRWVERMQDILGEMRDRVDRDIQVVQRPTAEGRQIITMIEPA